MVWCSAAVKRSRTSSFCDFSLAWRQRAASTDERKTKKRRLEAKQADQGEGAEGGRGQSSSTVEKKDRQGVAEEAVEEQERIEAAEKRKEEAEKDERTVFVYNLSFSTSTETLEEAFKSYGEIRCVLIDKYAAISFFTLVTSSLVSVDGLFSFYFTLFLRLLLSATFFFHSIFLIVFYVFWVSFLLHLPLLY